MRDDLVVDAGVTREERLVVPPLGGAQRGDGFVAQVGDLLQGHRPGGDAGGQPLQALAQLAHLVNVLAGGPGDEGAGAGARFHETVVLKPYERVADRGAGDSELLRDGLGVHPGTGRVHTGRDPLAQDRVELLGDRLHHQGRGAAAATDGGGGHDRPSSPTVACSDDCLLRRSLRRRPGRGTGAGGTQHLIDQMGSVRSA